MVKKLSDPALIQFLEKLSDLPMEVHLDEVKPVGRLGLMWRLRSRQCREGLGVVAEFTRALGQLKEAPPPAAEPGA